MPLHHRPIRLLCTYLALLACLTRADAVHAEINMEESLEWLSAKADRIVVGKIVKLRPASSLAAGKNQDLNLFLLQATETLKGSKPQPTYCIGVRGEKPELLESYHQHGSELLVFLEQTEQATSYDGQTCNLWVVRNQGTSASYLVPLAAPQQRMLAAATFTVLKDRDSILSACRQTIKRLPRPKAGQETRRLFLEVPFDTEVHKVLYSGSTCFLYVPEGLFPNAKPGLR